MQLLHSFYVLIVDVRGIGNLGASGEAAGKVSGASDIPCWNSGRSNLSPRVSAFSESAFGICIRRPVFWMALFT